MKNLFFVLFFSLLSTYTFAQCPPGAEVVLTSQAEVDAFINDYPNCTEIITNLRIGTTFTEPLSNITDISGLNYVTTVGSNLFIFRNPNLTTLNGLQNITEVGASLNITDNNGLTDLTGLNGLSSIGSNLTFDNNYFILSLDGLGSIDAVPGRIYMANNQRLTNIEALSALTSVGGDFDIRINLDLTSLAGLENLSSVGEDFILMDNHELSDVSALNHPVSIAGELEIKNNFALAECAVETFCTHLENDNQHDISNNLAGCNSDVEILAACEADMPSSIDDFNKYISVYPTLADSYITLEDMDNIVLNSLSIFDINGVKQTVFLRGNTIEINRLKKGLYFGTVQNETGISSFKFVKI